MIRRFVVFGQGVQVYDAGRGMPSGFLTRHFPDPAVLMTRKALARSRPCRTAGLTPRFSPVTHVKKP